MKAYPPSENWEKIPCLAKSLSGMGELAVRQGKFDLAGRLLEESLALHRALGERWGVAASLGSLGWAALLQRNYPRMREMLRESLVTRIEIGERGGTAWCLEKLAQATIFQAQALPYPYRRQAFQRAVQVFAAASALRAPLQSVIDPIDQPDYERILGGTARWTGPGRHFEAAWEQGQILPLAEIVDLALAPALAPVDAASLSSAQASKPNSAG